MSEKPEALRLADELENGWAGDRPQAAAELRRLHAENEVLTAKVKAREDEILTHSEAVYEATKLLSEEREKNERLREALAWIAKRCPNKLASQELHRMHLEVAHDAGACARAALRREET